MSFTCAVRDVVVLGEPQVMVPVLKRRVEYNKFFKKKVKDGTLVNVFYGSPTYGWEVVKEAPTTSDYAEALFDKFKEEFTAETKVVNVEVSKREYMNQKEVTTGSDESRSGNSMNFYL